MAVPKYHEYYNCFLNALSDGNVHEKKELFSRIKNSMKLSEDDISELSSSGSPLWMNRVGWCSTYLKKAGLIVSPRRAAYQITEAGAALLNEKVHIDNALLESRYPSFRMFTRGTENQKDNEDAVSSPSTSEETPLEILDRVYTEINDQLADELLTAVLSMSPSFFERLVVQLLEAMGYGGYAGAGFVTKSTGDGGIDGVINEDQLGFNLIYIQAKRWDPAQKIGKPEIQKFVGALMGPPRIDKGLFITTAQFSQGAKDYAEAQHIILVDGEKLTELMIKFNIGVSPQNRYEIKRLDSDFFEE